MKKVISLAAAILLSLASFAAAHAADLATRKVLTLDVVRQLAAAAEVEAVANKWPVCIAIVDEAGNLVYFQRLDNASVASIDIAQGKARTAARFKRPTKALEDAVAGGRTALLRVEGLTPLQGGVPIIHEGVVIGAIGVSGVMAPQDEQVAKAGVDALPKVLGK